MTHSGDTKRSGYDCVVAGAGIAGICVALDLQRRGATVALVDRGEPGSGASFGNAGILVNTNLRPVFAGMTPASLFQMLRNPASPLNIRWSRFPSMVPWFLQMLRHANPTEVERITNALASLCQPGAASYDRLLEEAGAGDLVQAKGNVSLMRSEEELESHWDRMSAIRNMGVAMEKLGPADMERLLPTVSPAYTHGFYSPTFRHSLDTKAMIGKFFELFVERGGSWFQRSVTGVVVKKSQALGISTETDRIMGDSTVLAIGTAAAGMARSVSEPVPHQAVGGYHVMLRDPGVILDRPILPMDFRFAITPMKNAIRLAGIYEFGGEGQTFRKDLIENMINHIGRVIPGIRKNDTTFWRGFRSYLPDGLPIISSSTKSKGLFYMFGFSSSGLINGPVAGRELAALICGTKGDVDLTPFSISRFIS